MTGQNLRGGRNHADIKRPAALRALSTCRSKPTKNGGHIPSPSDLSTGAIFHFVTIRKPLLALLVPAWFMNRQLYPSSFYPLYISSPPSLLLYFSISFRPRIAACHRDTSLMPRRECTVPAHRLSRTPLSIAWRRSLLPRINLVATNLHVPQWISAHEIDDPLPQSFQ